MNRGYESFFGLEERPFSLTPDPRYFFKGRSHGRAVDALTFGLRSGEPCLVVTGDLGVGKTMICRTFADRLRRRARVSYVCNPLLTPGAFDRLLRDDLGAAAADELEPPHANAVIIVDEAHALPPAVVDQLLRLVTGKGERTAQVQCVFIGQSAPGDPVRLGIQELDAQVTTKIRLLPLCRHECTAYIEHRLAVAGASHHVRFSAAALDYVFSLSGGVPRLVNLLCERALQEAPATGSNIIEPVTIDLAAATLQLLRARTRRFRWFSKRVS